MNPENFLWNDLQRLQREMDSLFNVNWGLPNIRASVTGGFPTVNIGTTPESITVYVFVPGLDPAKLDLSIQQNLLSIAGERKPLVPEAGQTVNYHRRERFIGAFRRVVNLPEDADPDQVNATYRNGVLKITIAKQATAKPRQIQINA